MLRLNSFTKIWYSNLGLVSKHVVGSLVDLFNWCQLHIRYAKYNNLFLKSLITEKVCHYLSGDMVSGIIMKN